MNKDYKFGMPKCPKCGGDVTKVWKIVDFSNDDCAEYLCPVCLHKWRTREYHTGGVIRGDKNECY